MSKSNDHTPDDPPGIFGTLILQEPHSGEADGQWKLAAPFFYEARQCFDRCEKSTCLLAASRPPDDRDGLCRLVIAKGTQTDLASIPRPAEWLFRRYGVYTDAAVIHDYLCDDRFPDDQRFSADWIFRNLMIRDLKIFPMRAWIMWAAVSLATFKERRPEVLIPLIIVQVAIWCVGVALIATLGCWGVAVIAALWPLWFAIAVRFARRPSWSGAMIALPAIITPMTPIIAIMGLLAVILVGIKGIEWVFSHAFYRTARPSAVRVPAAPGSSAGGAQTGPAPSTQVGGAAAPDSSTPVPTSDAAASSAPTASTPGAPPAQPPETAEPSASGQPAAPAEPDGRYRVDP